MAKKAAKIDRSQSESVGSDDFGSFIDNLTKGIDKITNVQPNEALQWISCYSVPINLALSGHPEKGLPFGRIINLEGESDTGKSLLGLTAIREAQKKYQSLCNCLVVDTERGMVPQRCAEMGIFTNKKPKNPNKPNVEDGEDNTNDPRAGTFKIIQTTDVTTLADKVLPGFLSLCKNHPEKVFILMVDSVSMLVTEHERSTEFGTRDMARAQELRKFMRLLNDAYAPNLMVLLVHHQTDRISTGAPLASKQGNHNKDIGGGKAMKFVPSVRIEISYGGKEKRGSGENERIIGQTCKIEVIKTRLFKPMIKAEAIINHEVGFTQLGGLADQLEQMNLIVADGARKTCPILFGEKKFTDGQLEIEIEKPENAQKVVEEIVKRMRVVPFGGEESEAEEAGTVEDLEDLEKLMGIK
jgi:RecA/RadA recombinase